MKRHGDMSVPSLEQVLQKKPALAKMLEGGSVRLLFVHGSVAKGAVKPLSDLDLAILLKKDYDFKDVSRVLITIEDVMGTDKVDLAILNTASPLLLMQVLKNGNLLFGCEEDLKHFRYNATQRYLATKHLRRQFNRYLDQAITGGDS